MKSSAHNNFRIGQQVFLPQLNAIAVIDGFDGKEILFVKIAGDRIPVFVEDVRIKFPDVYSALNTGIPLRRTNGNLDSNWKLDKQKMISKNDEFGWVVCFYKLDRSLNKIVKNIPLSIFIEDIAYSAYFKLLIKKLLFSLEKGFYNL